MNENKHLEEREIIIPHVKLALCFTEAKTTLLSFKGKEDINLDNVLLSDYPQRLHQLVQWLPSLSHRKQKPRTIKSHLVCGKQAKVVRRVRDHITLGGGFNSNGGVPQSGRRGTRNSC